RVHGARAAGPLVEADLSHLAHRCPVVLPTRVPTRAVAAGTRPRHVRPRLPARLFRAHPTQRGLGRWISSEPGPDLWFNADLLRPGATYLPGLEPVRAGAVHDAARPPFRDRRSQDGAQ